MRCKHTRAYFIEEYTGIHIHEFNDGKLEDSLLESNDNLTGSYSVKCLECGIEKHYTSRSNPPKWVKNMRDKVFDQ